MIKRPNGLACLDCGANSFTTTQSFRKARGFYDYEWRNLRCNNCGEHLQWGSPLSAEQPHVVMKVMPKAGPDGKTINIDLALPPPTSLSALIEQSTRVEIARWMKENNKTPQTLTEADRAVLLWIIKKSKEKKK